MCKLKVAAGVPYLHPPFLAGDPTVLLQGRPGPLENVSLINNGNKISKRLLPEHRRYRDIMAVSVTLLYGKRTGRSGVVRRMAGGITRRPPRSARIPHRPVVQAPWHHVHAQYRQYYLQLGRGHGWRGRIVRAGAVPVEDSSSA